MSDLSKINAMWILEETTFETNADADGSDYLPVKGAQGIPSIPRAPEILETEYDNQDNMPTAHQVGMDGGEISIQVPMLGQNVAAADGDTPATQDPLDAHDTLNKLTFGRAGTEILGHGIDASSGVTNVILDAAPTYGLQDLIPVYEASLNTPDRLRWSQLVDISSSPTMLVEPDWEVAPTTAAIAYGSRYWYPDHTWEGSFSAYIKNDQTPYLLLGCIVTGRKTAQANGGPAIDTYTIRYSSATRSPSGFASLPDSAVATQPRPLGLRSPIYFSGTQINNVANIEVDWGVSHVHRMSRSEANGKAEGRFIRMHPSVTIDPIFASAYEDHFLNGDVGDMLLQIGGGVLASSRINSACVHFHKSQFKTYSKADRNGEVGTSIRITAHTAGKWSTGVDDRLVQLAIA